MKHSVDDSTENGADSLYAVTNGGPGFVAVGSSNSGGDIDAAVWTSVDGITWSRVPHDETVFGGDHQQWMAALTIGGPGLVAVGVDLADGDGDGDAAVWISVDGLTWSRIPHDETVFGGFGSQGMTGVTAGGPGLVAVGTVQVGSGYSAAVWTSIDGLTWSRVPHDEAIFGGEGHQFGEDVTTGGPGLVAVGYSTWGGGAAAVWISVDGLSWSRVPNDEAVFGGETYISMLGVTAGGPGLVAVGSYLGDGDLEGVAWTSVDGLTWSRTPLDGTVFGGDGYEEIVEVIAGGPGLVAVGYQPSENNQADGAVWTSVDGLNWSRVPHDEAVFGGVGRQAIVGVAAGGPGLVAVGNDANGSIAAWISRPVEVPPGHQPDPGIVGPLPSQSQSFAPTPTPSIVTSPSPTVSRSPGGYDEPGSESDGTTGGSGFLFYVILLATVVSLVAAFLLWKFWRGRRLIKPLPDSSPTDSSPL